MSKLNAFLSSKLSSIYGHIGILLLRLGAGGLILTHGYPKFMKVVGGDFRFPDPIGLGPEISLVLSMFAEFFCGLLVIAGFKTRLASFILVLNMATAAFIAHFGDPFSRKEKALLFLVIFVVLLFTGGGKYSLDQRKADTAI
ncbi:MAG: DoxX family protein [Balneolaceae bacterium]|nr:DoxX family protein [Balneolaceae bacterium]